MKNYNKGRLEFLEIGRLNWLNRFGLVQTGFGVSKPELNRFLNRFMLTSLDKPVLQSQLSLDS